MTRWKPPFNSIAPNCLAVLHGEKGATGVEQPLTNLARIAHAADALLLVDTRWTISALDFSVDALEIDICVAGSQKAISAYPGLGLISLARGRRRLLRAARVPLSVGRSTWVTCACTAARERAAQTFPRRSSTR